MKNNLKCWFPSCLLTWNKKITLAIIITEDINSSVTATPLRHSTAPLSTQPLKEDTKTTRHLLPEDMANEDVRASLDTPALFSRMNPFRRDPDLGERHDSNQAKIDKKHGSFHSISTSLQNNNLSGSNSVVPYPTPFSIFGLLGSQCRTSKDCSVAYSVCEGRICTCRRGYSASTTRHSCEGK